MRRSTSVEATTLLAMRADLDEDKASDWGELCGFKLPSRNSVTVQNAD